MIAQQKFFFLLLLCSMQLLQLLHAYDFNYNYVVAHNEKGRSAIKMAAAKLQLPQLNDAQLKRSSFDQGLDQNQAGSSIQSVAVSAAAAASPHKDLELWNRKVERIHSAKHSS